MKIDLLFVCHQRLAYTKLALPSLLADPTEEFSLTIWDNASTDGTQEYLASVEDPRIVRRVFARENVHVFGAAKEFCGKCTADVVGFVANDFLFPRGWIRTIAQAHADVEEFGQISCWHLGPEFFDIERARHKIQRFGRHQLLRNPWTDGAGLVKVKTLRECGVEEVGTTTYGIRLAKKGYVNGFYFPLLCAEHMDYVWSEHFAFSGRLDEWLEISSTAKAHGIRTVDDAKAWHQVVVKSILDSPWEVKYYSWWRTKWRTVKARLARMLRRAKR